MVLVGLMLSYGSNASAAIILADGLVHNFPPETALDSITILDGPGGTTTTVNVLAGGLINGGITSRDSGAINVSGGSLADRMIVGFAGGTGTANISGGIIPRIDIQGTATATMTGGTIDTGLIASSFAVVPAAQGAMTITGGTIIGHVRPLQESTLRIEGGSFTTSLMVPAGSSHLTLVGTGFNLPFGDYFAGGPLNGINLIGTLADGSPLNVANANVVESATFTLAPANVVPEPSTCLIWTALGLAGIGARRRRQRA